MYPAHVYNLNGHIVPIQYNFKYLSITFNHNMNFIIHINNICNKAYPTINRLFRLFITNNYIYLLIAYISFVCLLVESDSSVRNPDALYITNSNHIDNIQKYITKRLSIHSTGSRIFPCHRNWSTFTRKLIIADQKSAELHYILCILIHN